MNKYFSMIAAASLLVATGAFAGAGHDSDDNDGHAKTETGHAQLASRSGPQLIMPMMNSARGRVLFAAKGCVACHSINGIGGEDAPNLDAHSMQPYMNPFEFAARMWRGAASMIVMQEEIFGEQIEFTGEELADIIAFLHDDAEQHKFSEADIPPEIMPMMDHMHGDDDGGGATAHAEELGHEMRPSGEDHDDEGAKPHDD